MATGVGGAPIRCHGRRTEAAEVNALGIVAGINIAHQQRLPTCHGDRDARIGQRRTRAIDARDDEITIGAQII